MIKLNISKESNSPHIRHHLTSPHQVLVVRALTSDPSGRAGPGWSLWWGLRFLTLSLVTSEETMLFISIRTFEKESLEINVVHNGCYFKLKEITFITLNNNTREDAGSELEKWKKNPPKNIYSRGREGAAAVTRKWFFSVRAERCLLGSWIPTEISIYQVNTKRQEDGWGNFYNLSFNWFSDKFIEFFTRNLWGWNKCGEQECGARVGVFFYIFIWYYLKHSLRQIYVPNF